jgi:hypothetical protein
MTEPIDDISYWKDRLARAEDSKEPHHAVFKCGRVLWDAIERRHRQILADTIGHKESVLDCGCGWGRLLDMMPGDWVGPYLGVDISPDMILKAMRHPHLHAGAFQCADLRRLSEQVAPFGFREPRKFDWAVLISIRPMVKRNLGVAVWEGMESEVRKVASRLLFLEYDPDDNGNIE